jgi:hypothetical protein
VSTAIPTTLGRTLTVIRYAWDSATVIGLFCGFAGNLLVWAAYNYWKGEKALIPFSMMKQTVVWTSCLFLGVLMGAMMGESQTKTQQNHHSPVALSISTRDDLKSSTQTPWRCLCRSLFMQRKEYILTRAFYSCQLLSADLLPSCQGRNPDNERRLPASKHPRPAFRRGVRWSSCWRTRSLSTFRPCLRSAHIDWLWPLLNFQPQYFYWRMDRLPNTVWRWTRVSLANLNGHSVHHSAGS